MKNILVIGGGLAGLSSAVYLSDNFNVTLIEASPKLGGRTYSFSPKNFAGEVDNGQHIMMGCYDSTLNFIKKINSFEKLQISDLLEVNFVTSKSKIIKLSSPHKFYPINLVQAILNYKAVPFLTRIKMLGFMQSVNMVSEKKLLEITAEELLIKFRQNKEARESLWDILIVGTMNTTPENVSANLFVKVLNKIFLNGNNGSKIIIPKKGLSEIFSKPASKYIEQKSGKILIGERVQKVLVEKNRAVKVFSSKHEFENFDHIVIAVPPFSLKDLGLGIKIPGFNFSPIVNIHFELTENPFKEKFYGIIGSLIHWVFVKEKGISITISGAVQIAGLSSGEILNITIAELEKYFPGFNKNIITNSLVVKEKRATFIPDNRNEKIRREFENEFANISFAGDWTNTGLPSTIESAVMSGKIAAEKIISGAIN